MMTNQRLLSLFGYLVDLDLALKSKDYKRDNNV